MESLFVVSLTTGCVILQLFSQLYSFAQEISITGMSSIIINCLPAFHNDKKATGKFVMNFPFYKGFY